MLLFLIKVMDKVVENEYTLVFCATAMSSSLSPPLSFLKKAYSIFNRKCVYPPHPFPSFSLMVLPITLHNRYKKNLKALYIIHPVS